MACSGSACNQMHFLQNLRQGHVDIRQLNTGGQVDYLNNHDRLNVDQFNGGATSVLDIGLQNLGHVDIRQLDTNGQVDYTNNRAKLNVDQFNGGASSTLDIGLQNLNSFSFLNGDKINIIGL